MPDLNHNWGEDLQLTPSGDLALSDGATLTQQRIERRLMTNPGEYIWHLDYGAGLPQRVGKPLDEPAIVSVIRSQIFAEGTVAQTPAPVISARQGSDPGDVYAQISYADAESGEQSRLSFDLSP